MNIFTERDSCWKKKEDLVTENGILHYANTSWSKLNDIINFPLRNLYRFDISLSEIILLPLFRCRYLVRIYYQTCEKNGPWPVTKDHSSNVILMPNMVLLLETKSPFWSLDNKKIDSQTLVIWATISMIRFYQVSFIVSNAKSRISFCEDFFKLYFMLFVCKIST